MTSEWVFSAGKASVIHGVSYLWTPSWVSLHRLHWQSNWEVYISLASSWQAIEWVKHPHTDPDHSDISLGLAFSGVSLPTAQQKVIEETRRLAARHTTTKALLRHEPHEQNCPIEVCLSRSNISWTQSYHQWTICANRSCQDHVFRLLKLVHNSTGNPRICHLSWL